ncbi:hypothetical protein [Neisseria bergeri]|uniref:hypothetical protein n=1 Tax=Neisseria bergeri TaxID=1906581 RepID=UPI000E58CA9E|nr:hypothetical protein [Neisseria bergeri]
MPSENRGGAFCPVPVRLPFYAALPFAGNIAHFFISIDFPLSVKILSHLSTTGYTQVQDKACGYLGFFRNRLQTAFCRRAGWARPIRRSFPVCRPMPSEAAPAWVA